MSSDGRRYRRVGFFSPVVRQEIDVSVTAARRVEANLRAVLGEANVKLAWGLAITPVASSQPGRDRVGGIPTNIGREVWPQVFVTFE